jgi:hypothetical protein
MMKDYIAMTSQSLMTLPTLKTIHKRCAGRCALYWPIFAGYRICFQQQCRNLKVTGKFIVTPPILNRFSTFLHHVVQNRKICNFCAGRQSVTAENFEI